jgi:hypothetical protein
LLAVVVAAVKHLVYMAKRIKVPRAAWVQQEGLAAAAVQEAEVVAMEAVEPDFIALDKEQALVAPHQLLRVDRGLIMAAMEVEVPDTITAAAEVVATAVAVAVAIM